MATYPTLATRYGSDPEPLISIEIDRAEDGTARGRALLSADKVKITVEHPYLDATDKATLAAFYAANRLLSFDYTSPTDGVARVMLFAAPIRYERTPGNRWTARVAMEEA